MILTLSYEFQCKGGGESVVEELKYLAARVAIKTQNELRTII